MKRVFKFRAWYNGSMMNDIGRHPSMYQDGNGNENNHVMQYTGLKDKNGVEIYEGDIIDYFHKDLAIRGEVVVGHVSWCVFYKNESGKTRLYRLNVNAEIEVIGNIYEK